jgi:hypothetical protein
MWHAWRQVRRTSTQFESEKHWKSDNFVDLGVDGRVIYKMAHLELGFEHTDLIKVAQHRVR